MHHFAVIGVRAVGLPAIIGGIRHVPELCTLEYLPDTLLQPGEETAQHTGPLLSAPPGAYCLWEGRPGSPLMVTPKYILMGSALLYKREQGDVHQLAEPARLAFKELLKRSERSCAVYQDMSTGHQKYRFVWPNQLSTPTYDKDSPNYVYLGVADLKTGAIE